MAEILSSLSTRVQSAQPDQDDWSIADLLVMIDDGIAKNHEADHLPM
jgi:hypothetical protein